MGNDDFLAAHLPVLAAVADHGGVTAAARALNLSQPAVSNRLRTLEAYVGGPLVVRSGRGVALTDLAETLIPHARAIVRATSRVGNAIASPRVSNQSVRVALSDAAVPLITPRLAACANDTPELKLTVTTCDAAASVIAVVAGDADLAVVISPPQRPADDLQRRAILLDEIVLVRAGSHEPLTDIQIVRSLTLLWQAPGSGVRATVEWILETRGVWPSRNIEIGNSTGALAAAAAGHGAAFLPRSFACPCIQAGKVSATSLDVPDLHARFELVSEPADQLAPGPRRVYDRLMQASEPIPATPPPLV